MSIAITVQCPNPDCGELYRVSEENLGKQRRCKKCGRQFTFAPASASTKRQEAAHQTQADSKSTLSGSISADNNVKQLGRFEIRGQLGAGAFGTVYRAHDPQLDREVALKVPHSHRMRDPQVVKRFINEAKAAARLQHPHIVPVFDAGKDGQRYYIASAFIEGETLDTAIGKRKLEFRETARIVMQLAEALAYAHQQGIVHRDVKPDNVMLDNNGEPHLMDFGLARLETSDEKLTQDGTLMGTPAYMSPEQARGDVDDVSPASDQYGLGATLYEMLCGEVPFSGPPEIVIFNVTQTEPPALRVVKPAIPRDLETICQIAMAKEQQQRYSDCAALADDLRRWLADEPIQARRMSLVERSRRWCRRNPVIASLLSLTTLLLLGLGVTGVVALQEAGQRRQAENELDTEVEKRAAALSTQAADNKRKREKAQELAKNELYEEGEKNKRNRAKAQLENDRKRVESLVDAELRASAADVPDAIKLVEPLKEYAVPILQERFDDSHLKAAHRLHAAVALAEFGQVHHKFLVTSIAEAAPSECSNIVAALTYARNSAIESLQENAAQAETKKVWRDKVRFAIVALHLDDVSLAEDMCQLLPDPIQRTIFIDECSSWHGDIGSLARLAEAIDDPALRSGICLGVGSISVEELTAADKQAWHTVLWDWYQNKPDTGTHSAAGWTLRKWELELPEIAASKQPAEGRHWHVNSIGMTMLKIPTGNFVRKTINHRQRLIDQKVILTRSFLLGDSEVIRAQFQQFIDDPDYRGPHKKPIKAKVRQRGIKLYSPTVQYPVMQVSWYGAVMFCNWLSHQEGLTACYEHVFLRAAWELIPEANGYRLPTEAEWEYACRAGTATAFSHGDDESLLDRYAVFGSSRTQLPGSKLPNGWGLFDMPGNVSEWCHDRYHHRLGREKAVTDPLGPVQSKRVSRRALRGGSFDSNSLKVGSAGRNGSSPDLPAGSYYGSHIGFRVARTYP